MEKLLLNENQVAILIERMVCQLIEKHLDFSNTALIGIQPRGIYLSKRLVTILKKKYNIKNILHGKLDITFFRDDFRKINKLHNATETKLNFSIENKSVVLIDDVLFTGRTARAALNAIESFGRPKKIELLVMVNRKFSRNLPVYSNYIGLETDTIENDKVRVLWREKDKKDSVYLLKNN